MLIVSIKIFSFFVFWVDVLVVDLEKFFLLVMIMMIFLVLFLVLFFLLNMVFKVSWMVVVVFVLLER